MAIPANTTGGIADPDEPDCWLVTPWPDTAGCSDVVRHFLMAYMWRLQGETSTARLLAYFTGYGAALTKAHVQQLSCERHDELRSAIDTCVQIFTDRKQEGGGYSRYQRRALAPKTLARSVSVSPAHSRCASAYTRP